MTLFLSGLRVLNTRPRHQATLLSQAIEAAGGLSIECPLLEIQAASDNWIKKLPDLNTVHTAIFISSNAVSCCFFSLAKHHISWPATIQVIAIGQATAQTLANFRVKVHSIPDKTDSEHLISLTCLEQIKNKTVLLFKGNKGRQLIENHLSTEGALLIKLHVYKRLLPKIDPLFIHSLWKEDLIDIILLTSEQSLFNLLIVFGESAYAWIFAKPCVVISERLAQAVSLVGFKHIIISHPSQIMDALIGYHRG